MKHSILALALVAAASAAQAQFKCTGPDGAVSLQQAPCPAQARSEPLALPPPSAEAQRPEHIRRAVAEGRVAIGMTRAELIRSAGRLPDHNSTSVAANEVRRQMVYRFDTRTLYVYLTNDIVTSFSDDR